MKSIRKNLPYNGHYYKEIGDKIKMFWYSLNKTNEKDIYINLLININRLKKEFYLLFVNKMFK